MSASLRTLIYIATAAATLLVPQVISAYGQGGYYSQSYYQGYYQTYYQTYYQGSYSSGSYSQASYGVTFTSPVTISGDASVTGALGKGGGSFVIDHPLDPFNKLLFHSFAESPEMKNLYDGTVTLNKQGEAIVRLPDYFQALNTDYRYQLKPINEPMPDLHVKDEISNNRFTIAGGVAGGEVSWQVTGNRQDPYALANPLRVEVQKGPNEAVDVDQYLYEGYETPFSMSSKYPYIKDLWQTTGMGSFLGDFTAR